ncbi:MAG TPA: hypothetical protein VFF53_03815 [Geobacteraceae bacterium]|nr:hypothetical protein [Geobacteraceae bacterium]
MRKEWLLAVLLILAGCGSNFEWFPKIETADTTSPVVSAFVFHSDSVSHVATIDTFTATDDVAVTGFLVTESATVPAATDSGWTTTPPTTFTFTATVNLTLYAWAKDAAGNVSIAKSAGPVYTVEKTLAFPTGVGWVGDIAFHKSSSSFWLLAGTNGPPPNSLVKISATTGEVMQKVSAVSWPFSIVEGSSLAFDGNTFWVSSNGFDSSGPAPVPISEIYRILANGQYFATFPCPATTTGFCQGLAWDGTNLWAAGSDNRDLVKFQTQAVSGALPVLATYANLWSTDGISDAGFDTVAGQVLVLKDGLITVNSTDGSLLGSKGFALPGTGKGDWDGSLFWVVDNTNKKLLGLSVK